MTQNLFDVFLTGHLLDGHNRREVIVNLAQLTGSSLPQATELLDGAVRMKAGVDQTTAGLYHEVLEETGAQAVVRACMVFSAEVSFRAEVPAAPAAPIASEPEPVAASIPQVEVQTAPPEDDATLITPELTPPYRDEDEAPALVDLPEAFTAPAPPHSARPGLPLRWPLLGLAVLAFALLAAVPWLWPLTKVPGTHLAAVGETLNLAQPYQQQVDAFWQRQGRPPANLSELKLATPPALGEVATLTLGAEGRLLIIFTAAAGAIAGSTLELIPAPVDAGIEWQCGGGTLPAAERPAECQ